MNRGTICYTTVVGALGHDQGTRPVLVIGRTELGERTGETIVLPISYVEPAWSLPAQLARPRGTASAPIVGTRGPPASRLGRPPARRGSGARGRTTG